MQVRGAIDLRSLTTWGIIMLLTAAGSGVLFILSLSTQVNEFDDWRVEHEKVSLAAVSAANSERKTREKKMEDNSEKMDQIMEHLEAERVRLLTIMGRALPGEFGAERAFIRVNRQSSRVRYTDGERVRITIMSLEGSTSIVLPINGTFSHNDGDLLAVFSSQACDELGVKEVVEVRLEPIANGVE